MSESPRELFGTRLGFVLAAAGSAIGLGNMWRFSYQAAEGGGAAFVILYLLMTFLVGVPIMAAEFAVGRRSRLSPIGALRKIGGPRWVPLGFLYVATPILILAYFSVIAGWTLRYMFDAILGFAPAAGVRFAEVATGPSAVAFHLVLMTATVGIVMRGVRKGIERAGLILMPLLILILLGLVVWASTLPNVGAGYSFYLQPSLEALLSPSTFQRAASQAFLSLSVGMGIMVTYSSYLSREESLGRQATLVSLSDFSVAFIAGLVVFPVIFALGLSQQMSESTTGTLFISIPSAFLEMGIVGRVVGSAFFVALVVAGLTSSVSLLEVATASLMDELSLSRRSAVLLAGGAGAFVGLFPALSQEALALMDKIAGELMVVSGVFAMAVLVGWRMHDPESELRFGASPGFARLVPVAMFLLRYVIPLFLAVILWFSLSDTVAMVLS